MLKILTSKNTFTTSDYPQAVSLAIAQSHINWLFDEVKVEKDIHDLRTNLTPAEFHGVISTLKLFTLYELKVGNDYWRDIVPKLFPRPEIQRMAAVFSAMELNVHAPFYNKINEALGLDTDEFYNSYLDDPILKDRMEWISRRVNKLDTHFDRLKSVAIFSMIEGAILYSSFAFLKHFQTKGKNKIININAGINFSAQDEDIHSMGGAWLYNTYLKELKEVMEPEEYGEMVGVLSYELSLTGTIIYEHESQINKKIFENGDIPGINHNQLDSFIQQRVNLCLDRLHIKPIFSPTDSSISEWFYNNLNSSILHDFFVKQGNDYSRNWAEKGFIW